jgi:hypothetical protein
MGLAANVQHSLLGVRNGKGLRIGYNTIPNLFGKLDSFGNAQLEDVLESKG